MAIIQEALNIGQVEAPGLSHLQRVGAFMGRIASHFIKEGMFHQINDGTPKTVHTGPTTIR